MDIGLHVSPGAILKIQTISHANQNMFGKKSRKKTAQKEAVQPVEDRPMDLRVHNEGLGHIWHALTGLDPKVLIPQLVGTVLHEGGTRPAWQWKRKGMEYVLMAWPADQPLRAAVLMAGPEGGKLKPVTAVPLLEGFPNDLTVEAVHPRETGGGDVAVAMLEGKNPMWFFDPLFSRDSDDLTPGVMHTFWLGAVALGVRKALLDEIAITQGPQYEAYAEDWLAAHPESGRIDVPPLKINIRGRSFIMPGRFFGEYQLRATIEKIEECQLDKMPIRALFLKFPFDDRPAMNLPLFVSETTLAGLSPEEGQEIEAYAWFEGRIIDLEQKAQDGGEQ